MQLTITVQRVTRLRHGELKRGAFFRLYNLQPQSPRYDAKTALLRI